MATKTQIQFNGLPKGVVGTIARDTTERPSSLKLKAPNTFFRDSTVKSGGANSRKR
jgi:hypothetical protein